LTSSGVRVGDVLEFVRLPSRYNNRGHDEQQDCDSHGGGTMFIGLPRTRL